MEWRLADIRCLVRTRTFLAIRRVGRAAALRPFAAVHLGRPEVLVRHVGGNDIDRYAVFRVSVVARVAPRRDEDLQHGHIFVREHWKMIRRL